MRSARTFLGAVFKLSGGEREKAATSPCVFIAHDIDEAGLSRRVIGNDYSEMRPHPHAAHSPQSPARDHSPPRMKTFLCTIAALTSVDLSIPAAAATRIGDSLAIAFAGTLSARADDNIFLSDLHEVKDTLVDATPSLTLTFGHGSQTAGSLELAETFTRYRENDLLDDELLSAVAGASFRDDNRALVLDAAYREINQSTRDVRSTALVRRDLLHAGIVGTLGVSPKISVGIGLAWDKTRYDNALYNDAAELTVPLNSYYALSEKLDLSAGFRHRQTSLDVASGNSKDDYANVGLRVPVSEKLSGFLNVGYNRRKPRVGDAESGLGLEALLHYGATEKTAFTLNVANDYATGAQGDSQKILAVSPELKTTFSPQWILTAGLTWQRLEDFSGREDTYVDGHVGLTYRIHDQATIGATYRRRSNDSDTAFTDIQGRRRSASFDNAIVSITANLRL